MIQAGTQTSGRIENEDARTKREEDRGLQLLIFRTTEELERVLEKLVPEKLLRKYRDIHGSGYSPPDCSR